MASLSEILTTERDRQEKEKWNVIHLFKMGGFYSAYEWSAWLVDVITYNDEVRKQYKDRQPLVVSRYKIAQTEETFCKVGFPFKSIEKYIPTRTDFNAEDNKHIVITIDLPTPKDGSEVTYERLQEAVTKWKDDQPIKEKTKKDKADPKAAATQPATQPAAAIAAPAGNGLISQILAYPLDQRTAIENIEFISMLKKQIATIL